MVKLTSLLLASLAILACSASARVPTESRSNSIADIERYNPVDALEQIEAAQLSKEERSVHTLPFPAPGNKHPLLRRAERAQPREQKTPTRATKPSPKLTREQQLILNAHNKLRARHHAPPLVWNDRAANHGRKWIQHCRRYNQHSDARQRNMGENIAWGTPGMFKNFGAVVQGWYDEEKGYNYNNPDLSRGVTSHFTQVVWRGTKSVGCAKMFCSNFGFEIYICNYAGVGNTGGEYARNVLRPSKRR